MPEHDDRFWSDVATKYDRVVDAQLGSRVRALVRDRLAQESALGHAVEIGCGSGFFTEVLARRAETLVATEMSGATSFGYTGPYSVTAAVTPNRVYAPRNLDIQRVCDPGAASRSPA
jgi:hypothetical protein